MHAKLAALGSSPAGVPPHCQPHSPGGKANEICQRGLGRRILAQAPHPQVEAEGVGEVGFHHHCKGAAGVRKSLHKDRFTTQVQALLGTPDAPRPSPAAPRACVEAAFRDEQLGEVGTHLIKILRAMASLPNQHQLSSGRHALQQLALQRALPAAQQRGVLDQLDSVVVVLGSSEKSKKGEGGRSGRAGERKWR